MVRLYKSMRGDPQTWHSVKRAAKSPLFPAVRLKGIIYFFYHSFDAILSKINYEFLMNQKRNLQQLTSNSELIKCRATSRLVNCFLKLD